MRRALLAICVLLALALAGAPSAALAQEPQASLPDIEDEVMCVVCGVVLEHAIDAPQAQQERELIRGLIAQGLTKEEIKDRLVAEYGDEVLAIPSNSGFDLAAWLVPGAAVLAAAVAIAIGLRRWRGRDEPPGGGRDSRELDPEDSERLDADLARYEL